MAETDRMLQELGLPVVTQEEAEELSTVFTSLGSPDSEDDGFTTFSADVSGGNKLDTVFYVNFIPKVDTLSPSLQTQLDSLSQSVTDTNQFISNKAGITVTDKVKIGELKSDQIDKQANYKAKVINHLTQNTPWIAPVGVQTLKKTFTVEKNQFHNALVTTFTEGLGLPTSINTKLEGLLGNIKSTIDNSSTSSVGVMYFVLMTIFQKDDVAQTFRPYLRTISFKLGQTLSDYTKHKGDKSSGTNVNLDIEYLQMDGQFNSGLYNSAAKSLIENYLRGSTIDYMTNKPINIPVDP